MTRTLSFHYRIDADIPRDHLTLLSGKNVGVSVRKSHNPATELDEVVVTFEGSGEGIVRKLATTADEFARTLMPSAGLPYIGQGSLDVIKALKRQGWNLDVTVPDTPYVADYLRGKSINRHPDSLG